MNNTATATPLHRGEQKREERYAPQTKMREGRTNIRETDFRSAFPHLRLGRMNFPECSFDLPNSSFGNIKIR